ncbi:MAG TPA: hypothetical protein VKD19_01150 [Pseudolabrys sp.]|nr:hypothetical protein [Pseudolabrys sp.]
MASSWPFATMHDVRKKSDSKKNEVVKAHCLGAVVMIAAATGFLALVFILNRAFDFSRFAY